MPSNLPPIKLDRALDDPEGVRRLIEANSPYYPVQRYFQNEAQYKANTGHARMIIAPVFRGDWAYDQPLIEGVENLLHHEPFVAAARRIFDAEIVIPQQLYVNLTWQLPFPQGPGHTDVPAFRGIDRTRYPTELLSIMGHSRLFEKYRVRIATAVAWFYQGEDGGFEYWPHGSDAPSQIHEGDIYNTAIVGDNDFMYHRVRPTGRMEGGLPDGMTLDTLLKREDGDRWRVIEGDRVLGNLCYPELRISLSWKANCFASADEARLLEDHRDDLTIDAVWDTLYADLEARGEKRVRAADPLADLELTELLGRTYVHVPATDP